MESIEQVCARVSAAGGDMAALVTALIEREEAIADNLRMAGAQFGLYPQIVAKVLADLEFGTPIDETQKAFVTEQFNNLMAEIRRQFGQ